MTYTKVIFSASVPLDITNLNMLGSQYDEMISTLEVHNHDDLYYSIDEYDIKYVCVDNDGHGSGANAATIDGYTKAQLTSIVPTGIMGWYFGNLEALDGWHLADGTNGTRNCLNKYIIGANASTVGNTGGNDVFTPTGVITVNDHILTIDEMPTHSHSWTDTQDLYEDPISPDVSLFAQGGYNLAIVNDVRDTGTAGGGQAHGHSGSTCTFASVDNRPLSRALYLIQKI